jgi:hypothetical protein
MPVDLCFEEASFILKLFPAFFDFVLEDDFLAGVDGLSQPFLFDLGEFVLEL